jgi:hypothetical protein
MLKGNQKKLDVNKNGRIDADDFKKLKTRKNAKNGGCMQIKGWGKARKR